MLAKNFLDGDKWIPRVVVERKGPLSYTVQIWTGAQWRRHVDQLRDGSEVKEGIGIRVTKMPIYQVQAVNNRKLYKCLHNHVNNHKKYLYCHFKHRKRKSRKNTYPVPALPWTDQRCLGLYQIRLVCISSTKSTTSASVLKGEEVYIAM